MVAAVVEAAIPIGLAPPSIYPVALLTVLTSINGILIIIFICHSF